MGGGAVVTTLRTNALHSNFLIKLEKNVYLDDLEFNNVSNHICEPYDMAIY